MRVEDLAQTRRDRTTKSAVPAWLCGVEPGDVRRSGLLRLRRLRGRRGAWRHDSEIGSLSGVSGAPTSPAWPALPSWPAFLVAGRAHQHKIEDARVSAGNTAHFLNLSREGVSIQTQNERRKPSRRLNSGNAVSMGYEVVFTKHPDC